MDEHNLDPAAVYRDALAGEIQAEVGRRWGNVSTRDLARRLGMNYETLRSRLDRRTAFPVEEVRSICRALGIDSWEMFRRASEELERRQLPAETGEIQGDVG